MSCGAALDHVLPVGALGVEDPQRVRLDPLAELGARARSACVEQVRRAAPRRTRPGVAASPIELRSSVTSRSPSVAVEAVRRARSPRRRRRGRRRRAPRRRAASAGGSGPSAAARSGSSARRTRPSTASPGWCCAYARTTGAVPSGRSARRRPPLSSKSYISLRTTSVRRADASEHLDVLEDRRDHAARSRTGAARAANAAHECRPARPTRAAGRRGCRSARGRRRRSPGMRGHATGRLLDPPIRCVRASSRSRASRRRAGRGTRRRPSRPA